MVHLVLLVVVLLGIIFFSPQSCTLKLNHIYLFSFNRTIDYNLMDFHLNYNSSSLVSFQNVRYALYTSTIDGNVNYGFNFRTTSYEFVNYNLIFNIFDLTQMFGSGNEPTIQEFNQWFTDDYYEYTLSKEVWVEDYNIIDYQDSDIMSQFSYQLYNAVDKYFNMDRVFNLGTIHQWFNNEIFGGQPSLYINVVWHIIAYEFVMDLLFLLYALFMWFIDMCSSLIERTYTSSSGGK